MKTIRDYIEKFIYEHLDRYISMVEAGGEDTVFMGIRVLDDPEKFVHGALINTTVSLYLYYLKNGDARYKRIEDDLKTFIKNACKNEMKTWGKLSMLRALGKLYKADKLDIVPAECIEVLKQKTDYQDFFDKSKLDTKGYPTNYIQVAMACAGLREMIGWDTEPVCEKICQKLVCIMRNGSKTGYMDEQVPYGRFDRYSIIVSSEIADTLEDVGKPIPQFVLDNLAHSSKCVMFMANNRGDGINYGRSLSCHGDGASLEILSSALANGLISEEDKPLALAYSAKICEKIFDFWYDKELGSFNIWWNGRSTNRYRQVHRVLEVNVDMANHMLTTLHNFELAGLADTVPDERVIPVPNVWQALPIDFLNREECKAQTIALRYKDVMVMLPLIGIGSNYKLSAYQPYPSICGVLEAAPEGDYPYLVPRYTDGEGRVYSPIQYYTDIQTEKAAESVKVKAKGHLAQIKDKFPIKSEYSFEVDFAFNGCTVRAVYKTSLDYKNADMFVGKQKDNYDIKVEGASGVQEIECADKYEYKTPHGAITQAWSYAFENGKDIGYEIIIK